MEDVEIEESIASHDIEISNYEFLQAYDEAKERIDDEGKRNEN